MSLLFRICRSVLADLDDPPGSPDSVGHFIGRPLAALEVVTLLTPENGCSQGHPFFVLVAPTHWSIAPWFSVTIWVTHSIVVDDFGERNAANRPEASHRVSNRQKSIGMHVGR